MRTNNWVTVFPAPIRKHTSFFGLCCGDPEDTVIPKSQIPKLAPRSLEQELQIGLQHFPPVATKTGVNGSFFLCDSRGQRAAIFKPMNMEAGAGKNHRLDAQHNVQFRNSILPGQGAGNEVLAYTLDAGAFGHRYGLPKTTLVRLNHPAFEGEELGSAQAFISNARSLIGMTPEERAKIPQHEWEKLNFRLISGSTDAHYGNILYCAATQKLYLIDSGDDFVGEDGQCQYYNPWVAEPRCNNPMSPSESSFLANLNIRAVMQIFEQQAQANGRVHPKLKVSADKYYTQTLRLLLAQTVGRFRLTQADWAWIMNSQLESIYNQHIRQAYGRPINWHIIGKELEAICTSMARHHANVAERLQFFDDRH